MEVSGVELNSLPTQVLLSFVITAFLATMLATSLIIQEQFTKRAKPSTLRRKLLSSCIVLPGLRVFRGPADTNYRLGSADHDGYSDSECGARQDSYYGPISLFHYLGELHFHCLII